MISRKKWKEGEFVGKTITFLTSSALALGVVTVLLAVTYILLKLPN